MADQKWQGAFILPIAQPFNNVESGVVTGFDAYVWNSPLCVTDPTIARSLSASNPAWTADTYIVLGTEATPGGGPTAADSLTVNLPSGHTAGHVYNTGLYPLPANVGAALAAGVGGANAIYVNADFWAQSNVAGASSSYGLDFYFYDQDGNYIANTFQWITSVAFTAANTWYETTLNNQDMRFATFQGTRANLTQAKYVRVCPWISASAGAVVTSTQIYASTPSLTAQSGLNVSLTPGIYDAGGTNQGYGGGNVAVAAAGASQRIDGIFWNWASQEVVYVEGSATAPATPDFCAPLWQVTVPANAVSLTMADLADVRQRGAIWVDATGNIHITGGNIIMNGAQITANGSVIPGQGGTAGNPVEFAHSTTESSYVPAGGTTTLSTGFGIQITANTTKTLVRITGSIANTTANEETIWSLWRNTTGIPAGNGSVSGSTFLGQRSASAPDAFSSPNGAIPFAFEYVDTTAVEGTTYYYFLAYACSSSNTGQPIWLPLADDGLITAQSI